MYFFQGRTSDFTLLNIDFLVFIYQKSKDLQLIYDFSYFRIWDHSLSNPILSVMETHSEFVYGLDFSNHVEGLLADCAWDQSVGIYHVPTPGKSGPPGYGSAT